MRYIIPKVNLSVFLLLSQRTIKMVSNDVSVTSLLWRHGDLYHAAFYQNPSWRFISCSVLPKSVIGRYITLRFTKIEMRSLWGQYPKKVHTYVTHSRSRYFMSLHYKWDMIWYMCCDIWYILSKKYGSAEYWYMYIIRQQEEMLNIPPVKTRRQESGSTLFAILHSSLIRIYTICHSQKSDQGQGLHCHSQEQSDQGLQYLPFSAVWSGSTLFTIFSILIKVKVYTVILRNSLIRFYTIYHSQQPDQGLHCLPFSAVWSGSTLLAILSSLIKVYSVCHSQQPV